MLIWRAVLSCDCDVNLLVVEGASLAQFRGKERGTGRRDVGLYAMNYGTAYVASIAHFSSYSQVSAVDRHSLRFDTISTGAGSHQ